jgi:hypothetical protein
MSTARASSKISPELVTKGVDQAMWAWLIDNSPITVPGLIEAAVERAFTAWLDTNREPLLERIADKIAAKLDQDRKGSAGTP